MINLASIVKLLGIKVPPEQIAEVEKIFPHVPGLVKHCIGRFNGYDQRLQLLEAQNRIILEKLTEMSNARYEQTDAVRDTVIPAGSGATERAFVQHGIGGGNG